MLVAGYTMDLYCRHSETRTCRDPRSPGGSASCGDSNGWEYVGQTFSECAKQARAEGWRFNRDNDVTCPYCTGKRQAIGADKG